MLKPIRHIKSEHRIVREKRHNVSGFLLVTDVKTQEIVGKLVNISDSGLCLLVSRAYAIRDREANKIINLLAGPQGSQQQIILDIERVWSEAIDLSSNYLAGYTYKAKNPKSKQRLKDLLQLISTYT